MSGYDSALSIFSYVRTFNVQFTSFILTADLMATFSVCYSFHS